MSNVVQCPTDVQRGCLGVSGQRGGGSRVPVGLEGAGGAGPGPRCRWGRGGPRGGGAAPAISAAAAAGAGGSGGRAAPESLPALVQRGGAVHKSTAAAARPAPSRAGKRKPKKQGPAAGLCTLASLCTNSPVAAQEEPHRRLHGQPRSRHGHQPAGQRVASGGPCDLTTNAYI